MRISLAIILIIVVGCAPAPRSTETGDAPDLPNGPPSFEQAMKDAFERCLASSQTIQAWATCYGAYEVTAARKSGASEAAAALIVEQAAARRGYAAQVDVGVMRAEKLFDLTRIPLEQTLKARDVTIIEARNAHNQAAAQALGDYLRDLGGEVWQAADFSALHPALYPRFP